MKQIFLIFSLFVFCVCGKCGLVKDSTFYKPTIVLDSVSIDTTKIKPIIIPTENKEWFENKTKNMVKKVLKTDLTIVYYKKN